jgi:hypothetical protein
MRKRDLTKEQISSVHCPTCGVGAGEPGIWNGGGLNPGPHLNRELSAAEVIERDKPIDNLRSTNSLDVAALSAPVRHIPLR